MKTNVPFASHAFIDAVHRYRERRGRRSTDFRSSLVMLDTMFEKRIRRGAQQLAVGILALLLGEGIAAAWAPSCEPAERYTLKNGLEVVLVTLTSLPTVAVLSSVHVGSRHDPPGYEGIAHYVEHLTFRATPPFASAFDLYQEVGAVGVNATTSPDTTNYFALVPSSQLERALWIEARRLGLGLGSLTEAVAEEERRVLLREHEMRYGWKPGFLLAQSTYENLFPAEHPYHAFFATEESIEQLTLSDARSFFAQFYRPERTRLVLVGDFALEPTKALIERHFGQLASSASPAPPPAAADCHWATKAIEPAHSRVVLRSRARNERLELYWPARAGEDEEALRGVFDLLKGEVSSAASQTGLSHGVNGYLDSNELNSYWVLTLDVAPGEPFDKLEPLVKRLLDGLRMTFADENDLAAQRQALELTDLVWQTRSLGRAQYLARRECKPAACIDAAQLLTASAVNQIDRFALKEALIVERRYDVGASHDGDLEVLP